MSVVIEVGSALEAATTTSKSLDNAGRITSLHHPSKNIFSSFVRPDGIATKQCLLCPAFVMHVLLRTITDRNPRQTASLGGSRTMSRLMDDSHPTLHRPR